MKPLTTVIRNALILTALAVAVPALKPKPAAALSSYCVWLKGEGDSVCALCVGPHCYGWSCNINGERSGGSGCF